MSCYFVVAAVVVVFCTSFIPHGCISRTGAQVGPANGNQHLMVIDRVDESQYEQRVESDVRYVPLTSLASQLKP